ncbi:MAG TPA: STAS domain-containing protein [Bryobacteraceae bacterium]|nr:STAS domain-containing protein [Bryobacteraceae bacterium]
MSAADAPAPVLTLQLHTEGEAKIVQCSGKLVAGVTDALRAEVKSLIPNTKRIILDLTALEKMDSMGLGTLVGLYVSAKTAGCSLVLVNLSQRIRQMMRITNVWSVLEVYGDNPFRMP